MGNSNLSAEGAVLASPCWKPILCFKSEDTGFALEDGFAEGVDDGGMLERLMSEKHLGIRKGSGARFLTGGI